MRLIDADTLTTYIKRLELVFEINLPKVHDIIDKQPTVDAEVVTRCKDCEWYDRLIGGGYGCGKDGKEREPLFYCGYGREW